MKEQLTLLTFRKANKIQVSYLKIKTNEILDIIKYTDKLKQIIVEFWIEETEKMLDLRKKIIDLMLSKQDYKKEYTEYDNLVRSIVETKKSSTENKKFIVIKKKDQKKPVSKEKLDNDMKLDIALILLTWLIYLEWWKIKYYNENIKQAIQYSSILEDKKYKNQILQLLIK